MGSNVIRSGYDVEEDHGQKKRHILVDTLGLLLSAVVHSADIQDRDGAAPVLASVHPRAVSRSSCASSLTPGYQGPRAALRGPPKVAIGSSEVVKRTELHTFAVLPKRWIVERTIAWLNRCRRLAGRLRVPKPGKALAFLRLAYQIRLMLRKLCNPV